MKKEDFLRELDSRLHILNEVERKDILDEYSQHIDLKIANGLSEEEAAGDFGDIKELASEILSAYNVNLKYNKPDVSNTCKFVGKRILEWLIQRKEILAKHWLKVKGKLKKVVDQNKEYSTIRNERKLREVREKGNAPLNSKERKVQVIRGAKVKPKSFFGMIGRVLVFLFLIPIGFETLACLFLFGSCMVLSLQGYPLVGATIGSAGMSMCFGALSVILGGYCFGKKEGSVSYDDEE